MIVCVVGNSQGFILPTKILDSMIFEVKKGRTCDSLQKQQEKEIKALGDELVSEGKVVKLLTSENSFLSEKVDVLQEEVILSDEKHKIEKKVLKTKINRLWVVITSETGVIILLILLI